MPGRPGGGSGVRRRSPTGPKTLFVVERNEKLQDAFREKFKATGFRVLLVTIDPGQAAKRYQQQAYHAVIIDARTVGHEGVDAYNEVLHAADNAGMTVEAILILSEEQANWKSVRRRTPACYYCERSRCDDEDALPQAERTRWRDARSRVIRYISFASGVHRGTRTLWSECTQLPAPIV